jgi:hypothetical protein
MVGMMVLMMQIALVSSFLTAPTTPSFVSSSKSNCYLTPSFVQTTKKSSIEECWKPAKTSPRKPTLLHQLSTSTSGADDFVQADDFEALQKLFSKNCGEEGLMTKSSVMQIPAISEMMVSLASG